MVCEFANVTIAELVARDVPTYSYENQKYIRNPNSSVGAAARFQHKGTTVTLTCNKAYSWRRYWHSDPDANKLELEALAKEWEAKEQTYLPIMQYFNAHVKDAMNGWAEKWTDRLLDLEHQIKELGRKLDACQSLLESTRDQQQDETNRDIFDCLEIDNDQIKGLWRALHLHEEKLFHFLDGEGDE